MKKSCPPIVIDNWPHPPIVLETTPMPPRRVCGVFVVYYNIWSKTPLFQGRGQYFSSTRKASAAMGYRSDRVGKALRRNKGGRRDGYADLRGNIFVSAEKALAARRDLEPFLMTEFRWLYDKRGARITSSPAPKLASSSIASMPTSGAPALALDWQI